MNNPPADEPVRYRCAEEADAMQWTGTNAAQLRAFCGPDFDEIDLDDRVEDPDQTAAVREADHGTWRGLTPGDWVVKLDEGLYEFSAADFAKQYEPAAPAVVSAAAPPTQAAKAEALLLHFTAEAHRRKWSYDRGLDDDGVPIKSEAFDALHRLGEEMRVELEKLRAEPSASSAVPAPVLAVLPAPVDRADVLRDFLWCLEQSAGDVAAEKFLDDNPELRRLAEAPQPETQAGLCGRTRSTDGGEFPPCARPAGHPEAYCRSADGNAYFLAAAPAS